MRPPAIAESIRTDYVQRKRHPLRKQGAIDTMLQGEVLSKDVVF